MTTSSTCRCSRRALGPRPSTSGRSARAGTRSAGANGCSRPASPRPARPDLGPCGLDIGADTQPETALSILAEILAVRAAATAGRCRRRRNASTSRWTEEQQKMRKTDEEWRAEARPGAPTRSFAARPPSRPGRATSTREAGRRVPLRRVRGGALPLGREVRLGLRLAELLPAGRGGRGRDRGRRDPRHAPDRGALCRVRLASRSRVPGRPAADRAALLHQLDRAGFRAVRRRLGRDRPQPVPMK